MNPRRRISPGSYQKISDDDLMGRLSAAKNEWEMCLSGGGIKISGDRILDLHGEYRMAVTESVRRGLSESLDVPSELVMLAEQDAYKPPQKVMANAKAGLELRSKYKRGGTPVGIARARDLASGKSIPVSTLRRMNRFFIRHEKNKDTSPEEGNGKIAWLLWGGDSGWRWAKGILKRAGIIEEAKDIEDVEDQELDDYCESAGMSPEECDATVILEAIERVPNPGPFKIEDGKPVVLDDVPEDSMIVSVEGRKWAQAIFSEDGSERARIITTTSRSRAIRRVKQEARRLRDAKLTLVAGEMQFASESGEEFFVPVGAFRWKGSSYDEYPDIVQESLDCDYQRLSEIREAIANPDEVGCLEWMKLGLAWMMTDEAVLKESVCAASDVSVYKAISSRLGTIFPGSLSVSRLLQEDRVVFRSISPMSFIRVKSGDRICLES